MRWERANARLKYRPRIPNLNKTRCPADKNGCMYLVAVNPDSKKKWVAVDLGDQFSQTHQVSFVLLHLLFISTSLRLHVLFFSAAFRPACVLDLMRAQFHARGTRRRRCRPGCLWPISRQRWQRQGRADVGYRRARRRRSLRRLRGMWRVQGARVMRASTSMCATAVTSDRRGGSGSRAGQRGEGGHVGLLVT